MHGDKGKYVHYVRLYRMVSVFYGFFSVDAVDNAALNDIRIGSVRIIRL